MAIIVKNMEMPESCDACPFESFKDLGPTVACGLLHDKHKYHPSRMTERDKYCPLETYQE